MAMSDILLKDHENELPQFKEGEKKNAGSLSLDATVVPVDMTYSTYLKLFNQVRKKRNPSLIYVMSNPSKRVNRKQDKE
jgi:hypothetical protein